MKLLILLLTFITTSAFAANCPSGLSFTANGVHAVAGNKLIAKLVAIESSYSKCSYRGTDQNGSFVSASIKRGTRRGQTSRGTLYINFENLGLKTKTQLKTVSYSKVAIDYSSYRGIKRMTATIVYSTQSNRVIAMTKNHSVRAN